jgi:hypothetical protein
MPSLPRILYKVRSLVVRPPSELWMLTKVVPLTIGMRVALATVPIRSLLRLVERPATPRLTSLDRERERRVVAWAAAVAGKRLFPDRPCLTQALVVKLLYSRRGLDATLRIGVRKIESDIAAHAWVESGGQIVIGGRTSPYRYHTFPEIDPVQFVDRM